MTITWVPLVEAFAYVLGHERDPIVTTHRLLAAVYTRKVRARGCVDGEDADMVAVEPLPHWLFGNEDPGIATTLNVEANSARHVDGWHGTDHTVFRLELVREDLFKLWPDDGRPRRGRKSVYDREAIVVEAQDYLATHARPKSATQFAAKLKDALCDKPVVLPGRTLLIELLSPLLELSAN